MRKLVVQETGLPDMLKLEDSFTGGRIPTNQMITAVTAGCLTTSHGQFLSLRAVSRERERGNADTVS